MRGLMLAACLAAASLALLTGAPGARAGTVLVINTLADTVPGAAGCQGAAGDCSLRQALESAHSGDTVVLPASALPYVLEHDKIPVPGGVAIVGAGAGSTTISGEGAHQAFDLLGGGPVTIADLTITATRNDSGENQGGAINGQSKLGDELTLEGVTISDSVSRGYGGAIQIASNLVIRHSSFVSDSALAETEGGGGAIDVFHVPSSEGARVTISDSVFLDDSAGRAGGGAVLIEEAGTLSVGASTFVGDTAEGGGPGGAVQLEKAAAATIANSTLAGNTAGAGGGVAAEGKQLSLVSDTLAGNGAGEGANLAVITGTVETENTIFALAYGGGGDCSGKAISQGHNLEDAAANTCDLSEASGDVIGQSPDLLALSTNSSQDPTAGGPPQTLALAPGSPALGAGSAAACAAVGGVDERGFPRPGAGSSCDIGAYELLAPVATSSTLGSSTAASLVGAPVVLTASVGSTLVLPAAVPGIGGTVSFRDGALLLGSAALDASGRATITTTSLPQGTGAITASYEGDAFHAPSSSPPLAVAIGPPAPVLVNLTETHRSWREGQRLAAWAASARRLPRGTVFAFTLNTPAQVQLLFTRSQRGRIAGGSCRAQTRHNRRHRACQLTVSAGSLLLATVPAGPSRVLFEGRLSRSRRLRAASYTVEVTARNASGRSVPQRISFTIRPS